MINGNRKTVSSCAYFPSPAFCSVSAVGSVETGHCAEGCCNISGAVGSKKPEDFHFLTWDVCKIWDKTISFSYISSIFLLPIPHLPLPQRKQKDIKVILTK